MDVVLVVGKRRCAVRVGAAEEAGVGATVAELELLAMAESGCESVTLVYKGKRLNADATGGARLLRECGLSAGGKIMVIPQQKEPVVQQKRASSSAALPLDPAETLRDIERQANENILREVLWSENALRELNRGFLSDKETSELLNVLLKRTKATEERAMRLLERLDEVKPEDSGEPAGSDARRACEVEAQRLRAERKALVDNLNQILRKNDHVQSDLRDHPSFGHK